MIKGLHVVRKTQPGKPTRWYVYAWRGGPCVYSTTSPTRPKLTTDILKAITAARESDQPPDPKNLLSLVREWRSLDPNRRSSPEWEALAPGTKKTWGSALDRIENKWGETPLSIWNDPRMTAKVVAWRDSRASTPRAADIGVMVLKMLLEFGRLRGRTTINVATGIPTLYRNGRRAEIIWTDADIARFTAVAEKRQQHHVVDALRLASLTGLRREDLVTLTWDHVGEFAIVKKALKRSAGKRRQMAMPRIPPLNRLLEELRTRQRKADVTTVLVNSFGKAWSGDGLGGSFNRVRDEAGIVHIDDDTGEETKKHLHDVRGTFCTKLMTETDLSDREVADIMGWSPDRVASIRRVYVEQSKVIIALGKRIGG